MAIVISMLISLTVTPMLASVLLRAPKAIHEGNEHPDSRFLADDFGGVVLALAQEIAPEYWTDPSALKGIYVPTGTQATTTKGTTAAPNLTTGQNQSTESPPPAQ